MRSKNIVSVIALGLDMVKYISMTFMPRRSYSPNTTLSSCILWVDRLSGNVLGALSQSTTATCANGIAKRGTL